MANIWEKAISNLAGNLNADLCYPKVDVKKFCLTKWKHVELSRLKRPKLEPLFKFKSSICKAKYLPETLVQFESGGVGFKGGCGE